MDCLSLGQMDVHDECLEDQTLQVLRWSISCLAHPEPSEQASIAKLLALAVLV